MTSRSDGKGVHITIHIIVTMCDVGEGVYKFFPEGHKVSGKRPTGMAATRLISGFKELSYEPRLRSTGLTTLEVRI